MPVRPLRSVFVKPGSTVLMRKFGKAFAYWIVIAFTEAFESGFDAGVVDGHVEAGRRGDGVESRGDGDVVGDVDLDESCADLAGSRPSAGVVTRPDPDVVSGSDEAGDAPQVSGERSWRGSQASRSTT